MNVKNRTEQANKATRTLNTIIWSKYISLNTNKRILCTGLESILSYCCEVWSVEDTLNKTRSTEMRFWRAAAKTCKILKVRKDVNREKTGNNRNSSGKNRK